MNVLGVGLDVCPVDRMARAVARHGDRFLRRVFREAEIAYARGRGRGAAESLAARFAAKEAVAKALGAPSGIGWHDVEILPAEPGCKGPSVRLYGVAAAAARSRGVDRVLVSLTHAGGVAAAVAVAVAAPEPKA